MLEYFAIAIAMSTMMQVITSTSRMHLDINSYDLELSSWKIFDSGIQTNGEW